MSINDKPRCWSCRHFRNENEDGPCSSCDPIAETNRIDVFNALKAAEQERDALRAQIKAQITRGEELQALINEIARKVDRLTRTAGGGGKEGDAA